MSSRRQFLSTAGALGLVAAHGREAIAQVHAPTPSMTEGPFYPEQWDPSPTRTLIRGPLARTVPTMALSGRVIDEHDVPVAGARIEIWQCDPLAHYHHSRDVPPAERDPGFAGFGWQATGNDGTYTFTTIRPVPYPGRTPHIHFAVHARGYPRLITQMFMPEDPGNARDGLFRSMVREDRAALTARISGDAGAPQARFDLVLARGGVRG